MTLKKSVALLFFSCYNNNVEKEKQKMSYDIYYTIRQNKKTNHEIDTLFFGKKEVYDYKKVFDTPVFDTYEECLKYINDKKLINVHIRKTLSTGGGVWNKDYKTAFNVIYKGKDFRKDNDKKYGN